MKILNVDIKRNEIDGLDVSLHTVFDIFSGQVLA